MAAEPFPPAALFREVQIVGDRRAAAVETVERCAGGVAKGQVIPAHVGVRRDAIRQILVGIHPQFGGSVNQKVHELVDVALLIVTEFEVEVGDRIELDGETAEVGVQAVLQRLPGDVRGQRENAAVG